MTKENVEKIIEILEHVRKKPSMYFGYNYNFETIVHYLRGFHMALFSLNLQFPRPLNEKDGWYTSYYCVNYPNKEQAEMLQDEYIIERIFTVEIEMWKSFRDSLEN
jgi:hypothetical protein